MGGQDINDKQLGVRYNTIDFQFGCQDSENGLFRTQHVDGIMGLSATEDTLPYQLYSQKVTNSKIFAMCFNIGGGILTLGGVNQYYHNNNENIKYAMLLKTKGWFTVKLLNIIMRSSVTSRYHTLIKSKKLSKEETIELNNLSIDSNIMDLNGKKGVIVDSGTTDTYLPSILKKSFETLFKKLSDGINYSNNNMILKQHQYDSLPIIIYRFESMDGTYVDIENHPSSYAEKLGNDNYALRIYLTEASGAVLGANFMNNHNVIFDIENKRIGFVRSSCKYDHLKNNINNDNRNNDNNSKNYDYSKKSSSTMGELILTMASGFLGAGK